MCNVRHRVPAPYRTSPAPRLPPPRPNRQQPTVVPLSRRKPRGQDMRAWWSGDLATLLAEPPEATVQRLAVRLVETHHLNHAAQLTAWRAQLALLHAVARGLPGAWRLLLEYPLLRLAKRIDAVLLTDRAILVLEFKTADPTRPAREQVEDYALDLFDFHAASRAHPLVPILVTTQGQPQLTAWPLLWHAVTPVLQATARSLPAPGARHRRAHPRPGPAARHRRLGSRPLPPGADHRRSRHHAVSPPRRRRDRRRARRRRQPDPHHRRDRRGHRPGPRPPPPPGAVRHRHPRRRQDPVRPEPRVRRRQPARPS